MVQVIPLLVDSKKLLIPCHLYTGGDHHCHDSTGTVLTMQRKIIALDLNEKVACVILGTMFDPYRFGNEKH